MPLTNSGRNFISSAIINSGSPVFFDNTHAYLCVGDSTTAYAAEQTDLQAVTNKFRKGMDATYPQVTDNAITFKSTFATNEANFAWNEWGVANASSGGILLNRIVENIGTKVSGNWTFTVTLTVSIGS